MDHDEVDGVMGVTLCRCCTVCIVDVYETPNDVVKDPVN